MNLSSLDVQTFALNREKQVIAILGAENDRPMTLAVSSLVTGKSLFVTHLGLWCECPEGSADAEWSHDGQYLIVAIPEGEGKRETIHVFDRLGKQVDAPTIGDTPRWLGDSHRFIFDGYGHTSRRWLLANVDDGSRQALMNIPSTLTEPAASPDGSQIAFDDIPRVRVLVYDLAARTLRSLGSNKLYPLWVSPNVIAFSRVQVCGCDGVANPYVPAGSVGEISVRSGKTKPARFTQTIDTDVWF